MIRATSVWAEGSWPAPPADRVILTYDERHRRRLAMRGEAGLEFLLDLPETTLLRDGDGLVLEDSRIVAVCSKPESLLQVRGRNPRDLLRLAWHLGNRHLAVAIESHRLLIRPDHVIGAMLAGLGAELSAVEAPFDPESGAYTHSDAGHRATDLVDQYTGTDH